MSQNYNPDKTSSSPGVTVITESVTPVDPIESHIPEQEPSPASNDTPPAAKDPKKEKPANPGKDNKGNDDSPRMPDFSKDEAGENGDSWSSGGRSPASGSSKGESFLTGNKELIKKIKNILDFVYPNSGITLAELLTGAKKCICMYAKGPGGGSGNVISGPGADTPNGNSNNSQDQEKITTDSLLDKIIAEYNKINSQYEKKINNNKYSNTVLPPITPEEKNDPEKRKILTDAINNLNNYTLNRTGTKILSINDDIDILMYIHDFIAETVKYYLKSSDKENSLFGCLGGSRSACGGMSLAVVFLCCYVNVCANHNIDVGYIDQAITEKIEVEDKNTVIRHIFNIVNINKNTYWLDASFSNRNGVAGIRCENDNAYLKPFGYTHKLLLCSPSKNISENNPDKYEPYLYYDHLFKKTGIISDNDFTRLKGEFINFFKSNNEIKSKKCDFLKDIVLFNEDARSDPDNCCIHLTALIRNEEIETLSETIDKTKRYVPLIYYFILFLASKGKRVLAELVWKKEYGKEENKRKYVGSSSYIEDIYDMYKGEKSIVASILIQSDLTISYDKYLVNTIFIKKPLEPQ